MPDLSKTKGPRCNNRGCHNYSFRDSNGCNFYSDTNDCNKTNK